MEQDNKKAFSLYTMAANHSRFPNAYAAYAAYELGRMCEKGIGTEQDQKASDKWYRLAYEGFQKIEMSMADDKPILLARSDEYEWHRNKSRL